MNSTLLQYTNALTKQNYDDDKFINSIHTSKLKRTQRKQQTETRNLHRKIVATTATKLVNQQRTQQQQNSEVDKHSKLDDSNDEQQRE